MSEALDRIVATQAEARECATQVYALAQAIIRGGKPCHIRAGEDDEPISVKQRGFFHAAVMPQIAEQVVVDGVRFTAPIWKELLRTIYLPDTWEMRYALVVDKATGKMRRAKRKTPHRVRTSTESLGVKGYSLHIDRCIDHAVAEWGVEFQFCAGERDAVRYVAPAKRGKVVSI